MNCSMSLEELKRYFGCSPKAEDFHEFWEKRVNKIKETKVEYSYELSELQVDGVLCYDFTFKGTDGANIYCKYVRPKDDGVYPTLFNFHGYYMSSGDWFDKITFAKLGYNVFAMDARGQGGKSGDNLKTKGTTLHGHIIKGIEEGPDNLAFTKMFLDTVHLVEIAKTFYNVDVNKMYAYGISQGGALSIACAALNKEVSKVFACYPFLMDYRSVLAVPTEMSAYGEINGYFKYSDPLHEKENYVFETLSYIDLQNFAEKMECELTMFTGLQDEVCSTRSQFAFYNKFKGKKEVIIYPQHGHVALPGYLDTIIKKLK